MDYRENGVNAQKAKVNNTTKKKDEIQTVELTTKNKVLTVIDDVITSIDVTYDQIVNSNNQSGFYAWKAYVSNVNLLGEHPASSYVKASEKVCITDSTILIKATSTGELPSITEQTPFIMSSNFIQSICLEPG